MSTAQGLRPGLRGLCGTLGLAGVSEGGTQQGGPTPAAPGSWTKSVLKPFHLHLEWHPTPSLHIANHFKFPNPETRTEFQGWEPRPGAPRGSSPTEGVPAPCRNPGSLSTRTSQSPGSRRVHPAQGASFQKWKDGGNFVNLQQF